MKSLEQKQNTLNAYDSMMDLKDCGVPQKQTIDTINYIYKIPTGTLYDWYSGKSIHGRKGKIIYNSELFYVLGALLGDGCFYRWKPTNNWCILVGDEKFTKKYSKMLYTCTQTKVKPYLIRSKTIWFVKSNNYELYMLFRKMREDDYYLEKFINNLDKRSALLFIEGLFDAEGCVKIIKEPVRITPKICLDITNTKYLYLELVRI